jgi:hypothetical protein
VTLAGGAGFVNGGGNNWASCPDCNSNGTADLEEILIGGADCNGNLRVDSCELADGTAADTNSNGQIDSCEPPTDRLVPSQYLTIQAAINASLSGDTVVIAPGTYNGQALVSGKSIGIRGEPGKASVTVINAAGLNGAAIDISGVSNPSQVFVRDLTLTHSSVTSVSGSGISYGGPLSAAIMVERCIIRDNFASNDRAGGAYLLGNAIFRECAFINNRTGNHGSGIYAYDGCTVDVIDCSFRDHTTGSGVFYARDAATVRVLRAVIKNANALCSGTTGTSTFTDCRGCSVTLAGGAGFVNGGGNNWASCPDCDADGAPDLEAILVGAADCDQDRIPDTCEVAQGSGTDVNSNGVLDQCECLGDIFEDGQVNGADLGALLSRWGPVIAGSAGDLNADGQVGGADLGLLLSRWGPCP